MIKNLGYLQYNKITCGKFCYCRNKDAGVGWDYQENLTDGQSCEFCCCHDKKFKYWSTGIRGWEYCPNYWQAIAKQAQEINIIRNMQLKSDKKND